MTPRTPDTENDDPAYWEKVLAQKGLPDPDQPEQRSQEKNEKWRIFSDAIEKDHHEAYALPDTMPEFFESIVSAYRELAMMSEKEIEWNRHVSCAFECDCFVLAIKGVHGFHINITDVSEYDREEAENFLRRVAGENKGIYSQA